MRNDSSLRKSVRTARRCAAIGFATAAGCLIGLLFLLTGGFVLAAATPAFVQEKDNQVVSGLTNRTTFSAATIAGNLIVVYLIWDNTGTASVSDSLGNAYVSAVGPTRWTNNSFSVQTFYTINLHGGADSVTATFATAVSSFGILYAHEYSGVLQTKPVDVTAAASGASGPLNSGSAATTNAVDLLFAGGVSANVVTGPGAGYTARSTLQGNITEDKVVAVNGPNSATASNGGGAWALQMVAFKGAAGGTLDTTPPTAPTNLSVAGTTASTVSLSWIAGTDNVGQTGYKIYRGGLQVGTSSGAFYTDTGRAASTTYAYTVSAFDAAGNNSARSATVNATTAASSGADTAPPAVSITSPQQNAIVSSSATVAASAADGKPPIPTGRS
jgi:chitodextrinase